MTKRFEYKTLVIKPNTSLWSFDYDPIEMDKTLNQYGREGWELVAAESRDSGGTSLAFIYTFKREI